MIGAVGILFLAIFFGIGLLAGPGNILLLSGGSSEEAIYGSSRNGRMFWSRCYDRSG